MSTEFKILSIKGIDYSDTEMYSSLVVRGKNKGNKAKKCKCSFCGGDIEVGEQYFRLQNGIFGCLGCVNFE